MAKDEPPDEWDDGEEEEKIVEKVQVGRKEKDLEFLLQDVVRDKTQDDYLKRDLQKKRADPKYQDMLVRITMSRPLFTEGSEQMTKYTNNKVVLKWPAGSALLFLSRDNFLPAVMLNQSFKVCLLLM